MADGASDRLWRKLQGRRCRATSNHGATGPSTIMPAPWPTRLLAGRLLVATPRERMKPRVSPAQILGWTKVHAETRCGLRGQPPSRLASPELASRPAGRVRARTHQQHPSPFPGTIVTRPRNLPLLLTHFVVKPPVRRPSSLSLYFPFCVSTPNTE